MRTNQLLALSSLPLLAFCSPLFEHSTNGAAQSGYIAVYSMSASGHGGKKGLEGRSLFHSKHSHKGEHGNTEKGENVEKGDASAPLGYVTEKGYFSLTEKDIFTYGNKSVSSSLGPCGFVKGKEADEGGEEPVGGENGDEALGDETETPAAEKHRRGAHKWGHKSKNKETKAAKKGATQFGSFSCGPDVKEKPEFRVKIKVSAIPDFFRSRIYG